MSSTSSSGGHFHRRWGSAGSSTSRTSPLGSKALSSTVEPSTYGTSWNSVRWNKPVTPGYRSQSSRIAASFEREKPSYYLSSSSSVPRREVSSTADKYLNPAAKVAANLASLGPSVSSRASRFDSSVNDKYRSEARDLISKYTSKERPTILSPTHSAGYYSRHFEPQKLSVAQESFTSPRSTYTSSTLDRDREPSASRYSVGRDYGSYRKSTSVTPTRSTGRYSETRSITSPGPSSGNTNHVLKAERPWRQRMAEGARVRAMHGEDVSQSYLASRASRRPSIGRGETDDHLTSSISALRNYVSQPTGYRSRTSSIESRVQGRLSRDHSRESIGVPVSASLVASARKELAEVDQKAMSRSYSPVRSKESLTVIPRFPTADIADLIDKHRASSTESKERRGVSTQPKDEPIKEEEWKERKRSARERSEARILSRQSSVGGMGTGENSSDEDHVRDKEEARRKRRASRVRRSNTRDMQSADRDREAPSNNGETVHSPSIGADDQPPLNSPGPLSPRMGTKLSRSASSKKMVPTKKQSIKSPCIVEVGGPSSTVISTPINSPLTKEPAAVAAARTTAAPLSPSAANLAAEDESMYNAVTSFKPAFKPKVKPLKPVPGTWKKDDEKEENISKNKTIERPTAKADASMSWKGPMWMSAKKNMRIKPKAVIKKEKEAAKEEKKEAEKKAKEEAKIKKEEEKAKKEEEKRKKEEEEKKRKEEEEKKRKEDERKKKEEEERKRVKKEEERKNKEEEEIKKFKKEEERKKKEEEERKKKEKERVSETKCSITLECPKERGGVSVEKAMVHVPWDSTSSNLREKKPKPIEILINENLKNKRRPATEKCERKWKSKSAPTSSTVSLQCASSSISDCCLRQSIDKKIKEGERTAAAKVHVISGPIDDVTMSRVRLRVRAALKDEKKRQSLPLFPTVIDVDEDDEKIRRNTVIIPEEDEEQGLSRSNSDKDTRAAIILKEMRVNHPQRRTSQDSSSFFVNDPTGPLVLPDKSILEEYVKRKRGKLEELREDSPFSSSLDLGLSDSFYRSDSPTDSTCSDLLPAPEVRIYTHSPRHSAHITTPSHRSSCSRLSSVEAATPTAMLDTLQPVQHSSPQPVAASFNTPGFLRHGGRAVTLTAKPLPFDTPKTPFEATLQNQANRIRNANLVHQDSTQSTTSLDEQAMQRSGLINSFNASIAANPRQHERYAAHLPHKSGELSGRTSAASMDSVQSGTLDAASKHVDNMIDQARFKHQAHRSKFKEAIDYLDNIFEDLKKEVDPSAPSTANASPGPSRPVRKTSSTSLNGTEPMQQSQQLGGSAAVKSALQREAMQKASRNANGALTHVASTSAPSHSNSLPNRSQRHRQQQPVTTKEPSPVEMSIRPVQKNAPAEDLEVSETVVLPRKTDKLDFTRRWLHDDLAGFTKSPPQMVEGPNTSMYSDPDEHSLGSCSAEVAAINNTKQKKRRDSKPKAEKQPTVQPMQHTQQPEKKLAPYRPQPVYGQPTNGTGARFPLDVSESLTVPGCNSLSRVASYDKLSERLQSRHSDVWRAASQEPYQTLGSVRSDDASSRPSPSAFHNVPSFQRGGMRGSIKSLPDAGLVVKTRHNGHAPPQVYYADPPRDPAMAIDALVAELELNTDQNGNSTDKRRSFPTALGSSGRQQLQHVQQPQRVVPAASAPAHQAHLMQQMQQMQQQPQQQRYAPQPQHQSRSMQQSQHVQQKAQPAARPAPVNNGSLGRSKNGGESAAAALDEVTHMLHAVSEFPSEKPKKNGSSVPFAAAASAVNSRPFDTINQERINPSRVEAIQSMFESRRPSGPGYGSSNDWRTSGKKNSREEDYYYDISEYSTSSNPMRTSRPSPPPHRSAAAAAHPTHAAVRHSPSGHAHMGGYQQQQGAPLGRNGSAGSSQNGGYYSSNSSCAVGPTTSYHQQQPGSSVRRQSISSRAPSVEDEDDGFYDNIGIYGSMSDDRRFSRGSELGDTVSMSSARLPPSTKPTRIGSFLSKIGARSNNASLVRSPGTAASLVSLNKVAMEPPIQQRGSLVKSNSLSNDPWRKEVIEGSQGKRGSSSGLGARLKNSLFGSKKRLN